MDSTSRVEFSHGAEFITESTELSGNLGHGQPIQSAGRPGEGAMNIRFLDSEV